VVWLFLILVSGCALPRHACDPACVSTKLAVRTGFTAATMPCEGTILLPNGATLADGLAEDEAVLIALWNNARFHATLAELGIAQGDLVQAGLLPNPEVGYFFSAPEEPFKYVLDMPLESLWLRPIRVAAAERESARACSRATQAGLDLIRDVRQA
jgi:cobalt-zinc-cadmium efflux system outer membrane protein